MSKLVTLEIGEGDFARGFSVTLRIGEDGSAPAEKLPGRLPPAQMIPKHYDCWKSSYRERDMGAYRKLEPIQGQTTNLSVSDSADQLEGSLNEWLNSGNKEFQPIRDRLLEALSQNQGNIRLIIETDDVQLWQLPWHLWSVLDGRYKLEPSFSVSAYGKKKAVPKLGKAKVRILVILGESTDINVQADLELLKEQLADAHIQPLIASRREQLSDELWEQNWDILFFAGHSSSESGYGQGRFDINETESITIEDLKDGLQNAINHGLCLAIFNSCDGLGLARSLASLEMPAIVVMRERVPDEAAQKFLKLFLKAFAKDGKSLSASVREARKRLRESMEGQYPCASWLPVLFENPAQEPPTWIGLRKRNEERRKRLSIWRSLQTVLLAGVAVTGLVMGVRWVGLLQPSELQAYDHLMQLRSREHREYVDPRILVVEITEEDTNKYGYPLKDAKVVELIKKLEQSQPLAIGLDLHRYEPREPGRKELIALFRENRNLFTVCAYRTTNKSYAPPREFSEEQLNYQVGFSDLLRDSRSESSVQIPDVRRQLLSYDQQLSTSSSACTTPFSFSFHLAFQFLYDKTGKGIEKNQENWQVANKVIERLAVRTGGYQNLDGESYQILINYRSSQPAKAVSLTQVLDGQVDRSFVKDKVVIIGMNPRSSLEIFYTPLGKMPAVWIHAHMVSQIISAAMDDRPLLKVLPQWGAIQWGDALWVWLWSLAGGLLAWGCRRSFLLLGLTSAGTIWILQKICLIILIQGIWMPLVPSALSFLLAGGSSLIYTFYQRRQQQ